MFSVNIWVLSIIRTWRHLLSMMGHEARVCELLQSCPVVCPCGFCPCGRHGLSTLCSCCPVQICCLRGASPLMTGAQPLWVWQHSTAHSGQWWNWKYENWGQSGPRPIVWCSGCCDSRGHFEGIALHQVLSVHFSYGCLWKRHSQHERKRTSAEHRARCISR